MMSHARTPSAIAPFTDDGAMRDESHLGFPMVAQPDPDPRLSRGPHPEGPLSNLDDATALARASTPTSLGVLAQSPDHAAAAMDTVDAAGLFDISGTSWSPDKIESKRARRLSSRSNSGHPPRRQAHRSVPLPSHRPGRSPARRSLWPGALAAEHRHIPLDPSVGDSANLNKLVDQLKADAEHMKVLKDGLQNVHEAVEAQAAITALHEQRLNEQSAINRDRFDVGA